MVEGLGRFRVNIHHEDRGLSASFRAVPSRIRTVEELRLPESARKLARLNQGLVLVTGPSGCGKSTTLAALIDLINRESRRHIICIEDPVEFVHETKLSHIDQREVGTHTRSFATALRAALREDPDVILVGEMRDLETIAMAITASETGHLVFSTLHTNDAAGAVTRLTDMGVEPFLIASTMIASIAQRLVRRLCPECAEPFEPDRDYFAQLGLTPADWPDDATFQRPRGCDACRNTGYRGRVAVYEILPFSESIKQLTFERTPSTLIKQKACELGMRTLREAGWKRVCRGETSFEELVRVTVESDAPISAEAESPIPDGDAAVSV
jgi:type II secretory ATPase GspE/PulE/Tfp pilus assembly ATPase PilB-like protein